MGTIAGMTRLFDRIVVLDWSAAGKPTRGANSIWIGFDDAPALNAETRHKAWRLLRCMLSFAARRRQKVLIAADFAFGFPRGLAGAITGTPRALAMWDHLATLHTDDRSNASNYRDLAAAMNLRLGLQVFWGNNRRIQIDHLPRLRPPPHPGLPGHRLTEARTPGAPRPKSPFQLAGAGAVGAQTLTGIAWLSRLRQRPGAAVWPFQPWDDAAVVLAEVYPSMIDAAWQQVAQDFICKDAAQVTVMAHALRHLDDKGDLVRMMTQSCLPADVLAEEGCILGHGHADLLMDAAHAVTPRRPWVVA